MAATAQHRGSSWEDPDAARPRGPRLPPLTYAGLWQAPPPLWLESRVAGEYMALLRDPVFRGQGVSPGRGRGVLLIPGFLAGDWSLLTMKAWLRRCGYRAELPGISLNVDYSELILQGLERSLRQVESASGGPVTLVGHSRGGILAKVLGDRHPDLVGRVVTLGSPLARPFEVHPVTMAGVRVAHLYNVLRHWQGSDVEATFLESLAAAPKVPVTSFYSRTDGVVSWNACVRPDLTCVEVPGSHVGLAVNAAVYRRLGSALAA